MLLAAVREQTDSLAGILQAFSRQLDERFTKIESWLDSLDQKSDQLNYHDRWFSCSDW